MAGLALITGASSGIGAELAREHARRGGDVVLVARRADRLADLARELESEHGVRAHTEPLDLTADGAVERLVRSLEERRLVVEVLVNNAGFGGQGRFHEREWRLDQAMIRLNVMALTELTRRALPGMVERGRGRVLNVASVAGFLPGPLQAVYFATKAYVVSLSEALAHELRGTGVTVTALCPGATATEFAERAGLEDALGFKVGVASAASVARAGYRGMERGRTLVVPGFQNALLVRVLLRLAPRSLAARVAARFNRR